MARVGTVYWESFSRTRHLQPDFISRADPQYKESQIMATRNTLWSLKPNNHNI